MTRVNVDHTERHPKAVLICDKTDELSGVCEIISSQVNAFRTLSQIDQAYQILLDCKPDVIIFAMSQIKKNIELYLDLTQKQLLDYPYDSILLCDNKDSGIAFKCCYKGIFNDYFVFKPMYEHYRLRMLLYNSLVKYNKDPKPFQINNKYFGPVDHELNALIDQIAKELEDTNISNSTLNTNSTDLTSQDNLSLEGFTLEILKAFKQEHVVPLLDMLEMQLATNIEELILKLKGYQLSSSERLACQNQNIQKLGSSNNTTPFAAQKELIKPTEDKAEDTALLSPTDIQNEIKQEKIIHILIVEDNEIYCEMISKILNDEGYIAETASTGKAALTILANKKFDIIFMDLFMPELDGYNTTKKIRSTDGNKKTPIVALTSNRNKDLIKRWASLGLSSYIAKPSTKQSILSAVNKVLNHSDS